MKIIGANITGSFILNSQDVTTTIQTSNVWSGSVATDITALNASTASLNRATSSLNAATASLLSYTASNNAAISDILLETASFNAFSSSILNYTASTTTAIADILLETASFNAFSASILNYTASTNAAISDILLETASINTFTSSIDGRVSTIEGKYITTGSNTFVGVQYVSNTTQATTFTSTASLYTDGGLRIGKDAYVSGSAFIKGNLTVFGTSSIEYVTSSVFVGLEYIDLNTDLPALRYAGIRVYDSGSNVGVTGSLFWDSQNNRWIYSNPSGSSYSGGMLISGPRASTLGSEEGTTNNALMKGQGGDHITSSAILDDGTSLRIPYLTIVTGTVGATTFSGSGANLTSIPNAALTNSTISGIALGSNLATLTIGTGLSGTSYNGSGAVTIANTGVTSIVAGTNISISGGTGAVTITNGITNNNQLTNGAGYITSAGNAATATALSSGQSNWSGTGVLGNVVGLLAWKNYGNSHVIFDASNGTSPSGGGVSTTNATVAWTSTYPTLMGWNGSSTYGVRVDSARISDSTSGNAATVTNGVYTNIANTLTGQLTINAGQGSASTVAYTSFSTLTFDDSFSNVARGPNKIITYGRGTTWVGGIGIHDATQAYYAGDTHKFYKFDGTTATLNLSLDGSGNLVATGNVTAYSDARVKENINPINNALSKVLELTGVTYNRIDLEDKSTQIGFIAQEVEKIIPEVVSYDKLEDRYSVSYGNVTALLVEAIKEQQTQIEELKTIINGLTK
jgi:hypothetical protein